MKTNAKLIIAFSTLALAFLAFRKFIYTAKLKAVNMLMTQGKWKVNQYRDNGVDETSNYTGYEFLFKPNGTLVAMKDNNMLSGHWKSEVDKKETKLSIDFDSASDLDELSEDWQVLNKTDHSIELEEPATGYSGIDYLNLERIS
ncbi:MAG: hypothetical protein K0S44_2866 [Bacteroidetes bacterium]|jgi:hypothetical protein|nr:hypothetical protein [Bacteroidota bacterium]